MAVCHPTLWPIVSRINCNRVVVGTILVSRRIVSLFTDCSRSLASMTAIYQLSMLWLLLLLVMIGIQIVTVTVIGTENPQLNRQREV